VRRRERSTYLEMHEIDSSRMGQRVAYLGLTPASMLAGESALGDESIEITDTIICSTPITGRHRSSADYAIN